MSKFMIANITWNSTGWEDVSHDKSNFGWVKEHPRTAPSESWNFYLSDIANSKRGFFQVRDNAQPTRFLDNGIVFFFSRNISENKNYLVGIYANARYVEKTHYHDLLYNLIAPTKSCLKFYKYVRFDPKRHLPPNRIRIPQVGYTYINERNARNIVTDALRENAIVTGVEENALPKSDFLKLSRIARSYFNHIPIPEFRIESEIANSFSDFIKKEFPNFSSDDRITITKNNAKLKRSYSRHQDLLNRAIELLREKGWRRLAISSNADLLAGKGQTVAILEAKSITLQNLAHQIRVGISQLYEYSFQLHNKGHRKQKLILVLERQPESKWFDFCQYCDVELWYKENKVIVKGRRNSV